PSFEHWSHRSPGIRQPSKCSYGDPDMRIVVIGQQDFGKTVLDAFLARGDEIAGVFCAPEKPGTKPDPLRVAAQQRDLRLFQLASLKGADARKAIASLDAQIG